MAIIDKPSDFFETLTWSGNSTDNRAISGLDFAPNWVWIKCRNNGQNHNLFDTVRGATESIESNGSNAENTDATSLKSFTSDGYTLGTGVTVNGSSKTYVGWNWKAGTSFTNDASSTGIGSIDSTGSVNTDAGFSIVSWDGSDANGTIAHGLGSAPRVIIIKNLESAEQWYVYHESMGNGNKLTLNDTSAQSSAADWWQDTSPTSSVFSVSGVDGINGPHKMIAYCFAPKQSFSKMGSYTGNGNADGTFVYTGFKPAFVMLKGSSIAEAWWMFDSKRSESNVANDGIVANGSNTEYSNNATFKIDILSNGFKIRDSDSAMNSSGNTYIYMAFAENPFVASNFNAATAR